MAAAAFFLVARRARLGFAVFVARVRAAFFAAFLRTAVFLARVRAAFLAAFFRVAFFTARVRAAFFADRFAFRVDFLTARLVRRETAIRPLLVKV
jgi:hypothetical protein